MIVILVLVSILVLGGLVFWSRRKRLKARPSPAEISAPLAEASSAPSRATPSAAVKPAEERRSSFARAIASWIPLLRNQEHDREKWEEVFITSDLGPRLTKELIASIEKAEDIEKHLRERLYSWIQDSRPLDHPWKSKHPWVLMMVGVNGSGKTTTLAKLARALKNQGLQVGVVGADTFRKAAVEQLERQCQSIGVDFFTILGSQGESSEGADPAAVVFDGLKKFRAYDVVLVDTSGRLQNKKNLMEELKKMKRVADKSLPGAPHDIWLTVDATLGQNAIQQGQIFHQDLGLTGLVLTKMDGLSRGGTIFQLFQELKTPIYYIGLGETSEDLEEFDPQKFIQELFDLKEGSP